MKIQFYFIIAFSILLTSCATITVTPTPTVQKNIPPAFTKTPIPKSTATSEPYSDTLFTKPLGSLVLTPNDIPPLDINYPQLIEPEVQDLTSEIQNCGRDCVKVVWESKAIDGVSKKQVSIILVRMNTDLDAAERASASWNEFFQVESDTGFTEGTLVQSDLLPNNSKVGISYYKEPDVDVLFTSSRGPIYMKFVYSFQAFGDLVLDFGSIQHLAILQIEKLADAGYPK